MTATAIGELPTPWRRQRGVLSVAALLAVVGLVGLQESGTRLPWLWLAGIALGFTLYHAAFGFTGAYRALFLGRGSGGGQAQLGRVARATLLFAPLFAQGATLG
ncbi:MAG: YeeE/YedE family protein, partial [Gammaproteobacteria bacterium]